MSDTIAAISTGGVRAAIGILRLSGDRAVSVAEAAFRPAFGGKLTDYGEHRLILGDLVDEEGRVLDRVLATWSRGPNSFTGEDTAELQGHGSPAALQSGLRALFRFGARQAGPGEFSRRAFLNGRLDLTQAEAIMDLIDSETAEAARNAAAQLNGAVTRKTEAVYQQLLNLEAHFQAVVDYPEEGVEPLEAEELAGGLREARDSLRTLLGSYERGLLLKEGIRCALIGRPNAGKSSLLNALMGEDRAIVTPEAGTTRDTLEEKLTVGGVLLRLTDTAGLRKAESAAEAEGIRRAEQAAAAARLVLAVFDGSEALREEDLSVCDTAAGAPYRIAVLNKCDLPVHADVSLLNSRFPTVVSVSARTGEGIAELERAVRDCLGTEEPADPGEILTNARQYDAILRAEEAIGRAEEALRFGLTPDAVLTDAEDALSALGELSGKTLREDLADAVFSRFCVGK